MTNLNTKLLIVDINLLDANPWNPNEETPLMFDKVRSNIKEFGFIDPVLVREKDGRYQIIDGEHRWRAAKELGFTEVSIQNMGEIHEFDAEFLTVQMNNLRGEDNLVKRGQIFKRLKEQRPELLAMLPLFEDQVNAEIGALEYVPTFSSQKPNLLEGSTGITFRVLNEDLDLVLRVLESLDKQKDKAFMTLIKDEAHLRSIK